MKDQLTQKKIPGIKRIPILFCLLQFIFLPMLSPAETLQEETLLPDGTELGAQFRKFAQLKHEEILTAAKENGIDAPPQIDQFFDQVESNQWSKADSLHSSFTYGKYRTSPSAPLATGMTDIAGLFILLTDWNRQMTDIYIKEALRDIPDGSIVIGGTDPGRFFITYGAETIRNGHVTVITQNALANPSYVDYLRWTLSHRMTFFTKEDYNQAYQQYIQDVQAGRKGYKGEVSLKNGRPGITGVQAVMEFNGEMVRKLGELNHAQHPVFVEESYAIDWMYDYMTPHGLIMQLHDQPVTLTAEVVAEDRKYWQELESRLNAIPAFSDMESVRGAFSKCRCSIAELYEHHNMDSEAEFAYRQSLRLLPTTPIANYQLADLLTRNKKYNEARTVLPTYLKTNPPEKDGSRIADRLKNLVQLENDEQAKSPSPKDSTPDTNPDPQ